MTAFAATANAGVHETEESRRGKTTGVGVDVTQAAIILCRDMVQSLADCDSSIMASGAVVTIDVQMIEANTGKGIEEVRAVT